MRTAEVLPAGAARAAALRRAGAACGCAALGYLVARSVLTALANALLALRVPGASLANPAGTGLAAAILLQAVVSALSLAAPFALLPLAGGVPAASPRRLNAEQWAALFLLFWLLIMGGNLLAGAFTGSGSGQMDLPPSGLALAAAWLAVCLVPAVGEELLFRGLLQGWLRPFGPVVAVAGQALLFALLHGRAPAVAAALFGGTALGIAAACSGSLVPGMAFHLYNNTLAFAGQYCQQYGAPQIICYLLMFLPPLAALAFAPWRALPRRGAGRLRGQGRELLRLLRSPGYLTALAVLAALSLFKTIGG